MNHRALIPLTALLIYSLLLPTPATAQSSAVAEIFDMLSVGRDAETGRVTQTSTDSIKNETTVIVIEFVRPDRVRYRAPDAQTTTVGGQCWVGAPGQAGGMPMPGTFGLSQVGGFANVLDKLVFHQSLAALEAGVEDLQAVGQEVVSGVPTKVYTWIQQSALDVATETYKAWMGEVDGLVYRWERRSEHNKVESDKSIRFDLEYGMPLSIEAPG